MARKVVGLAAVALLAMAFMAASAKAGSVLPKAPNLDFSSQTTGKGGSQHSGGYVGYTPGLGNDLSITGAPIFQLQEPSDHHTAGCPAGRCSITDGSLNIFTGGCMMGCKGPVGGSESAFFSGQGSSVTITGAIPGLGISSDSTKLLQGYFVNLSNPNGPAVSASLNSAGSKNAKVQGTGGIDGYLMITYIDPTIIQMLGLNGTIGEGYITEMYFNLNFLMNQAGLSTWDGSLTGSDILVVATPEAASLILLGTAFLAAAWFGRRRMHQ